MKISILLLLLLNNVSFAEFLKLSDLDSSWGNVSERVKRSVVKFEVVGNGRCSGSVISNEGHVLTAMHCFHRCLKSSKAYKVHRVSNKQRDDFFVTVNQDKLPTCNIRYKNYSFDQNDDLDEEIEYGYAKIVASGKGKILLNPSNPEIDSIFDFHQSNKDIFSKLKEDGIGRIVGDFVIFKSDSFKSRHCAKVEKADYKPKKLLSLSFPNFTFSRPTGENPNGRSMYASIGKVSEEGVLKSNSTFVVDLLKEYGPIDVKSAYQHNLDIVWSDNDILGGSSGSPTFTESGKVFSLTTYNICDGLASRNQGCKFSSGGITMSKILRDLKSINSPRQIQTMFSCR